jgi:hypothetical protein
MFLKNIKTGVYGEFPNHQGNDWEELSSAEMVNLKREKIKQEKLDSRKYFLKKTRIDAMEYILANSDYPGKEKREKAKQEIKEIEAAKTLAALNKFTPIFE